MVGLDIGEKTNGYCLGWKMRTMATVKMYLTLIKQAESFLVVTGASLPRWREGRREASSQV